MSAVRPFLSPFSPLSLPRTSLTALHRPFRSDRTTPYGYLIRIRPISTTRHRYLLPREALIEHLAVLAPHFRSGRYTPKRFYEPFFLMAPIYLVWSRFDMISLGRQRKRESMLYRESNRPRHTLTHYSELIPGRDMLFRVPAFVPGFYYVSRLDANKQFTTAACTEVAASLNFPLYIINQSVSRARKPLHLYPFTFPLATFMRTLHFMGVLARSFASCLVIKAHFVLFPEF